MGTKKDYIELRELLRDERDSREQAHTLRCLE